MCFIDLVKRKKMFNFLVIFYPFCIEHHFLRQLGHTKNLLEPKTKQNLTKLGLPKSVNTLHLVHLYILLYSISFKTD